MAAKRLCRILLLSTFIVATPIVFAQQVGSISGTVTATDGSALPGVTVEAHSNVLPQPRVTTTVENGDYRLPVLPVGRYTVTFSLAGMDTVTRSVQVQLSQDNDTDVTLGVAGVAETITVTADASLVDTDSTEIKSAVSSETIEDLPVGQEYRDLVKLAPAVQYSADNVRGPSSGGSGQDNVYQFDGVNVTLPLFGTLASEPASYDIEEVSVVRGGAKAVDFNRAGGFSIDSVSKSGTSEWKGQVSYQIQSDALTSDVKTGSLAIYDRDRTWSTLNVGGPLLRERLFFYGSYYRPTIDDSGSINAYGQTPDYKSTRNEYFGKLTYTPLSTLLLNGSYRTSKRDEFGASIGEREAGTASAGNEARLRIGILEASWVISNRSYATANFTDFANETLGRPDLILGTTINTALGTRLDLNALDQMAYFSVPAPVAPNVAGAAAYNAFIQPFIDRYGFIQNGVRTGGGAVGGYLQFDDNDFFRQSGQAAYDVTLGSAVSHDLHFGAQHYTDAEDLTRTSNGWGQITVPGGRANCPANVTSCAGQPIFFQAQVRQQTLGSVQTIRSEYESTNLEVNDTIRWNDWSFNVGVLASADTLYGMGLRENPETVSGFEVARGNKYKMYSLGFGDQIQPRLGATWAYNGSDSVYASYARYNPAASSLPRAASWARNLDAVINAYFNAEGVLIGVQPEAGSTGKLFQDDLTPRTVNEYLIGTSQQVTSAWSARAYGRYRYTNHFWEDTNNNARLAFAPPEGVPRELYIADLAAKNLQLGTTGSYVIAELDGAFTKYLEATVESDWRGGNMFLRGSYTFSHYYGNFDQDNTTSVNDANSFIGSSFIADAAGRQLWNNRYGRLRGDRPHLLKVYGSYQLPWKASVGAFGLYQSGHPWEYWSYEPYVALTSSTSDTSRYAEAAGTRRTPSHYQIDLNYTQNFAVYRGYNIQLAADVYNLLDKQTGYNPQPSIHAIDFRPEGGFRSFYAPRRIQIAARLQF
jgi:hypothetical protein